MDGLSDGLALPPAATTSVVARATTVPDTAPRGRTGSPVTRSLWIRSIRRVNSIQPSNDRNGLAGPQRCRR